MTTPEGFDLDALRAVVIGILDKLKQIELMLMKFDHLAPAQNDLAQIRAWRVITHEFLTGLREIETKASRDA